MDNSEQPSLTAISIGPGIRGIERGISRVVRFTEIALVEIESFIIENLVAEMEQCLLAPAVIWSDAKTFPAHLFRGKVNLLLAGYPCQPFSNSGRRRGTEDPRHLYPYIERTIDIVRPDICFFENVRGHITLGLREVIESLEGLGYRVHWGIFSAEETGASHKRERVFIMAIRQDILDASSNRLESKHAVSTGRDCPEHASEGVGQANSEYDGCHGAENGESVEQRDNSNSEGENSVIKFTGCGDKSTGFNAELADPNNNGERTRTGENDSQSETIEREEQRTERNEKERERSRPKLGYCSVRKMGYTTEQRLPFTRQGGIRELQKESGERVYNRPEQSSTFELGNSACINVQGQGQGQRENEIRGDDKQLMGDTNNSGLQGRISEKCGECTYQWFARANDSFARKRHVARPGQPQHEWESPRAIITGKAAALLGGYSKKYPESFQKWQVDQVAFDEFTGKVKPDLGSTVDGYDFREDFLRSLGNSVYEDTSELAFRTLLKKHGVKINLV